MNKIGIIGAGNIGMAIAKGMVSQKVISPSNLYLSRKKMELLSGQKKEGYQVTDNLSLVSACDIIILAVLPGQALEVILELKEELQKGNKILVSVVSAVSIQELKEWSGNGVAVVRIMPNTAAEFGASMTCVAGEDEDAVLQVKKLFDPLGQTMVIKEHLMPAATILAACGIAFFLRFIRAVSQGGIQIGFHAEEAGKIAAQTAMGAAELLLKTHNHPELEIDRVTTPMGCTISGLNEMEHFGLSSAMIKGIVKSYSEISDLK
ncbi:MAG: pyrroline-5-carboxylate reductase [Bacteroidia bacterium]|nr:MAG: pyrroline-5-carboxylate reductase [Bacteroidia bacterium]